MPDGPEARKFTAELRQTRRGTVQSTQNPGTSDEEVREGRHQAVMAALRDIRTCLAVAPQHAPGTPQAATGQATPEAAKSSSEGSSSGLEGVDQENLLRELADLKKAIEETKQEIAVLRRKGKPPAAPLENATNELDAVVQATEKATEGILAAAETIDGILMKQRNQASSDDIAVLEEASEQVVRIFESCNFQDITGQRITKVVNTMKFIEDRVEKMITILGGMEAFNNVEAPPDPAESEEEDEDAKLMEGPQLDEAMKISQDDIDKLFP